MYLNERAIFHAQKAAELGTWFWLQGSRQQETLIDKADDNRQVSWVFLNGGLVEIPFTETKFLGKPRFP